MRHRRPFAQLCATALLLPCLLLAVGAHAAETGYDALLRLHADWRAFEAPVLVNGVPDYGPAAIARKAQGLASFRARLAALDAAGWTASQRVDRKLVEAEMNGLDFDLRIVKPWARDPAFYVTVWPEQSDTPSHEGTAARPQIDLWRYAWPLSKADQKRLAGQLATVAPLLEQARANLKDGDAHELWLWGSRPLHDQAKALAELEAGTLTLRSTAGTWTADLKGASAELKRAVRAAREASSTFADWVAAAAPSKTGPSGVGKENYTWAERNVHLVPYSWEEQEQLLKRELERAHAALRLEEYRNRALPPLKVAADAQEMRTLSETHVDAFVDFLVRSGRVVSDRPTLRSALLAQITSWAPPEQRNFFLQVTHREPMLLLAHQYHWLDLARMRDEPHASPVRREPLLYNIWDSRAEGFATAFEEITMHAGLYDANPRARELVWIMLANRAARGLASLYAQSNQMTLRQAGEFAARWTPRGWAPADSDLTGFEQLLYLRQPGYGASYVTGKLLVDRMLADWSHRHVDDAFDLRAFLDEMNGSGLIPVTLIEEEIAAADAARVRP